MPETLRSLFNFLDQEKLVASIVAGNAKFSFNIPPTITAFVAIITFSSNPNFVGSASYRTVASFLISLATGFNGAVVDVLSSAPLFQPATPGVNSTSLGGLFFGTGNSGSNERPTTGGGGGIVKARQLPLPGFSRVSHRDLIRKLAPAFPQGIPKHRAEHSVEAVVRKLRSVGGIPSTHLAAACIVAVDFFGQESKIPAAGLLTDPALKPLSESALYLTIAAAVMITIAMMLFKRTL